MVRLDLSFDQRINLELLLGQQRGDLNTSAALLRVIQAVRLQEDERGQCRLRVVDSHISWDRGDYPQKAISLENADAERTVEILNGYDQFIPSDAEWAEPLRKALKA